MKFLQKKFFRRKGVRRFLVLFTTIVFFSLIFCFYTPEELVDKIGIQNGYLLMFFISLFGGVSIITSGSYLGTLITLSLGGLNPFLLAILSGVGATFGDSVFFFLGRRGHTVLAKNRFHSWVKKLNEWLNTKPKWFIPLSIYFIVSFTPIPNDALALTMGFARRSYTTVVVPLVLGNITFVFLIAILSRWLF